jgi:hypothetical protein
MQGTSLMIHLSKFLSSDRSSDLHKKIDKNQEFLLLGKGPSFSHIDNFDLTSMINISLNHVIREIKVDIAHLIDFDVFEECENEIYHNARYLLMPNKPHFKNQTTGTTLQQMVEKNSCLKKIDQEGRLIWYNLRASKLHLSTLWLQLKGFSPVNNGVFSSDTLVQALAVSGAKRIRTLGVDGGSHYSLVFKDLESKTLLNNQQESFDNQFIRLRRHINNYEISYQSLMPQSPIRIFIGTADAQSLAAQVLAYSIKKNTGSEVEFRYLNELARPYQEPVLVKNRQRTPFSFQRFLIPEACDYEGRAIYLDSDMLVFSDIENLWSMPMGNNDLLSCLTSNSRRPHYSVMLLDCHSLRWNVDDIVAQLDKGQLSYHSLMNEMSIAARPDQGLSKHWNSLESFQAGITHLLHFTDMETQPWVHGRHPLGHLWVKALIEAVAEGYIDEATVQDHQEKKWIRPSLAYQVSHSILHYSHLPAQVIKDDQDFLPPYEELVSQPNTKSESRLRRALIRARKVFAL